MSKYFYREWKPEEHPPRVMRRSRSQGISFDPDVSYTPIITPRETTYTDQNNIIEVLRQVGRLQDRNERINKIINVISNITDDNYIKELLFMVVFLLK